MSDVGQGASLSRHVLNQAQAVVRLRCPAGQAKPGPAIGQALGPHQGRTRVIVESLTVPVRFNTISEQKRDETKPTRPLTASECPLLVETVCHRHSSSGISFSMTLLCGPGPHGLNMMEFVKVRKAEAMRVSIVRFCPKDVRTHHINRPSTRKRKKSCPGRFKPESNCFFTNFFHQI